MDKFEKILKEKIENARLDYQKANPINKSILIHEAGAYSDALVLYKSLKEKGEI